MRDVPRTLWLDGLTAGLAVGAVSAAVVLQAVLSDSGDGLWSVATNLGYPIGDLVLIGLVVTGLAIRGWRPGRSWTLLGIALTGFWIADSVYLVTAAQRHVQRPRAVRHRLDRFAAAARRRRLAGAAPPRPADRPAHARDPHRRPAARLRRDRARGPGDSGDH